MQLVIYATSLNLIGRNLQKKIQSMTADTQSTYCPSLRALETYLRKPIGISSIGILIPANDGELAALIGMRHLLRDMRLILILPEYRADKITHSRAHLLRPRYISYADGDLSDVTAVLGKMKAAGSVESCNRRIVKSSWPKGFKQSAN